MSDVIGYANISEIVLSLAGIADDSSSIPGISSPKIDATTSVTNIETTTPITPTADLVGWSTDLLFTADDYDTVSRGTGTISLSGGTDYTISAIGSTGNMTGITYIYLDTNIDDTVLQITTTSQTSVGTGKILVAVCKPVSDTSGKAIVQPFGTVGTDVYVTAENIANETITFEEIAPLTITASQIANNTITAVEIQPLTITASQIANNTITSGQILANTITSNEILANTITASQMAANTITANEIAANTITSGQILANTITSDEMAANTITASQIASNTITAGQIAALTITSNEIASGTITAEEIAANTITASEIAASTITTNQILAGTILASDIASNTITANEIAANTIDTAQLKADSIDGMTITGATIRTASSGERAQMDSNYFSSYDSSDEERIRISGSTIKLYDGNGDYASGVYGNIIGGLGIFAIDGAVFLNDSLVAEEILPTTDATYDLGSSSFQRDDLYIKDSIYIDGTILDESIGHLRWDGDYIPVVTATASGTTTADSTLRVTVGGTEYTINAKEI